jgi:uncharacterized protein (TIGR03083 family)
LITGWIAAERRSLADVLDGLSAEQWATPSLCEGWTVRHVVAHLTMPFRYSAGRFMIEMAKAGGSFQRMSDKVAERDSALPAAELVAAVRDNAEHQWKPPGGGFEGALAHDVIHGLDITSPLRIDRTIAVDAIKAVLDTITSPQGRKHFGVDIDGIRLQATDIDWSCGSGTAMTGRARDLALFLSGRRIPDGAVSGAGTRWPTGGTGQ